MTGTEYLDTVVALIVVAGVGVGGYFLSRAAARRLRERGAQPATVRGVRIAVSLVAAAVAAGVAFSVFGPIGVVSGLTFSALIGLALTLALQTRISNVVAGFILLRDGLLRLDDRITIGGITGKVVQLGLITTWLRLDDGALASVSNSTLLSGPLVNRSAGERLKGEF